MSLHQLNFKTNDLVLPLKTIYFEGTDWNCFLTPIATDIMDGDGLKLEKLGHFFFSFDATCSKILKKFIMVSPL